MFDAVSFLFEIIAVFLGVFAAFWLDNYREGMHEISESIRTLRMIREELNANLTVMEQLQGGLSLDSMKIPYFGPQFALWRGVSNKIGLIENDILLRELSQVYYRFEVLDHILTLYSEHYSVLTTETDDQVLSVLRKRVEIHRSRARDQLADLIPRTQGVITKIGEEIKRLS
jgi:hypothetical protein